MTTEIWRVHFLWIFQITKITRAKLPIQNCLSGGFQERVGVTNSNAESLYLCRFPAFVLLNGLLNLWRSKVELFDRE